MITKNYLTLTAGFCKTVFSYKICQNVMRFRRHEIIEDTNSMKYMCVGREKDVQTHVHFSAKEHSFLEIFKRVLDFQNQLRNAVLLA